MPINYFDIENGVTGFSQKDYQLERHSHFPIEVAFTLSGQLNIKTDKHHYQNIHSVIVNSNVPHTFCCRHGKCQLYFIEPHTNIGKHILTYFFKQNEDVILIDEIEPEHFKENHILNFEKHDLSQKILDNRIQRCLNWINENYTKQELSIADIAENVFLSESRLAHLFKEQMGISIQQYILWKRIEMAILRYKKGYSLTDCAHHSGFADSSHFNKTFKKMFGIYPSFANQK
ncbi:MAG TPA: AraC family transcriptional regulator [Chitinophagaceae bacterium]|nr:AraC family transcriptional regulator [Chitinophagaceae bacterium]